MLGEEERVEAALLDRAAERDRVDGVVGREHDDAELHGRTSWLADVIAAGLYQESSTRPFGVSMVAINRGAGSTDGFHFHGKRIEDCLDAGRVWVFGTQGDELATRRRCRSRGVGRRATG